MKVSLFVPCFMDQFFPNAVWKAIELLEAENCEIYFEKDAFCCSQTAFNSGYHKEATEVAKHLIDVFTKNQYPIVILSGSCCAMVRLHYEDLNLSSEYHQKWLEMKNRIYEFSEFWVNVLNNPPRNLERKNPIKVLFHRSCHALRELRIVDATEKMLQKVKNLDLVYTEDFDACCGFGGTFAVKFPEISVSMADEKLHFAMKHNVDGITSLDMSCLMHLQARAQKQNLPLKFWYAPELLVIE